MRMRDRLSRFLMGRYGMDAFYRFSIFAVAVLLLLGVLVRRVGILGAVLSTAAYLLFFYQIFRAFSRNIISRQKENRAFLNYWNPTKAFFVLQFRRVRDCKTKVYRKCPQCRAVLCLPRKGGQHTVRCPGCAHRFAVTVRGTRT